MIWCHLIIMLLLGVALSASARTLYVSPYGTNDAAGKYPDWVGAASTIPPALLVATNGDKVLVTDGVYTVTAQLSVTNGFTLISVNGPDVTSIDGNRPNTTNRCMSVNHSNTVVSGFTISNAYYDATSPIGAGVQMILGLLTNCVVERNWRYYDPSAGTWYGPGGGVGIEGGLVQDCVIRYNTAKYGGGVHMTGGRLVDCAIYGNSAAVSSANTGGGGVCMRGGEVSNCVISVNSALKSGGGVWLTTNNCVVRNCRITDNSCDTGGAVFFSTGGMVRECVIDRNYAGAAAGAYLNYGGYLQNCLIYSNRTATGSSSYVAGGIYTRFNGTNQGILSCTIANNSANGAGGGIYYRDYIGAGGLAFTTNCIIYGNTGGSDQHEIYGESTVTTNLSYCCLSSTNNIQGPGNITNNPQFINPPTDYRLSKTSPCVNAGINMGWMNDAMDLQGFQRIDRYFQRVDIGAYEYLQSGTMFTIR